METGKVLSGSLKINSIEMISDKIKIALILLFMLNILSSATGQNKEIRMADSAFITLQYNTAAEYYEKAIKKFKEPSPEKQYATYRLAECYRIMNEPDLAMPYYKELCEGGYGTINPEVFLKYAAGLKTAGDIVNAKSYYEKYLKTDPGNQEAKVGLESCDWILSNQRKRLQVNVVALEDINSSYDDFGPAFLDASFSQVVFTSNRFNENTKNWDQWTGSPYSDLYFSSVTNKGWSDPAPFEFMGKINSEVHEGSPGVSKDFDALYFTRCDRAAEKMAFCQIWRTEKIDNKWKTPELVMSDSSANIGQPSVSKNELTLVFSADISGSKGNNDIWIANRESRDSAFGKPAPLSPVINTPGDEVFPYLYDDTTLLFSSNGFEGYGGWDVYQSIFRNNKWSVPENMLTPVNSGYDDFGIIIRLPNEEGYFSSNRPGGQGGDDIYHFYRKILLFTASGHVKDKMTLLSLQGVQVMLIGENDTVAAITDKHGFYSFDTASVLEDHAYQLSFKKEGYFSAKDQFSTFPYEDNFDFTFDITLEPIPEKPIVLPDILYELDKWDLAQQYQDSLMMLVRLLQENESLVIELRSHTDSRGSDNYNDILSQKRAQSVVDFLVSQGIEPGRLVAKGYGERIVRVLDKDCTREKYTFKSGTELTDNYINGLPSKEIREAAYQLNRRTEFAVLAKDYKPGSGKTGAISVIQVVSDSTGNAISYSLTEDKKMKISGYINDFSTEIIVDPGVSGSVIAESIVMDLLKKGAIDRNDFSGNFEEIMVEDRIKENSVVALKKIRLGEVVIVDSQVTVKDDASQALIIGNDLLEKTGDFLVDEENKQIIFK
jgi:peptidoglycan-associated lipoprotein